MNSKKRREFLQQSAVSTLGLLTLSPAVLSCGSQQKTENNSSSYDPKKPLFFKVSLAEWSLNKMLFAGKLDHLEFPAFAKSKFGIEAVEYVNQFFPTKAEDNVYLQDLKSRTDNEGISNLLIMIDHEGGLGDTDNAKRQQAVENHYKWVEAAKLLGCHSIRVNAFGEGSAADVQAAAIDGLGKLTKFSAEREINVIVENHGGYSSDGNWLSEIMKAVSNPYCGTLPDFGNFCLRKENDICKEEYDRYLGTEQLLPFAKGISAKSFDFDTSGNETTIDYKRMLEILKKENYGGYIGIEYEGDGDEVEGIKKTLDLLSRVGAQLS